MSAFFLVLVIYVNGGYATMTTNSIPMPSQEVCVADGNQIVAHFNEKSLIPGAFAAQTYVFFDCIPDKSP